MTNLEAVFLYVRQHAPSAATGDGTGKFRDLLRFYFTKQDRWEKGGTTEEKARVRTLVSVPLTVCGVAPDGEDLLLRANEQKLALTATVMTMSIVLNLQQDALTRLKQKLERLSSGQLQELFKTFLTKGDLVTSKHSGLELKNFGCLGELQEKYMTRAETPSSARRNC